MNLRTSSCIAAITLGGLGLTITAAMARDNTFPPPQGDPNTVTAKPNPLGGYDYSNGVTSRPNPQGGIDYSNGVSCRPTPQGGMYCWAAQPPPR